MRNVKNFVLMICIAIHCRDAATAFCRSHGVANLQRTEKRTPASSKRRGALNQPVYLEYCDIFYKIRTKIANKKTRTAIFATYPTTSALFDPAHLCKPSFAFSAAGEFLGLQTTITIDIHFSSIK